MDILRSLDHLNAPIGPSVVTLGNFDGVHLGHRALFRQLKKNAQALNCCSVVYTFNPHPLKLLAPERAPLLLNTPEEKTRLIAASQVDVLIEAPFTREFAAMPPEQFVNEVLIGKLKTRGLVIGYDYAFGRERRGDAAFLQHYGTAKGIQVEVLQPVSREGEVYSSTRIRELIGQGEVAEVVPLLGRQYNLEGVVVEGDGRGRKLGFPTANLATHKEQLPKPGVYAVMVRWRDQELQGVVNIGKRPTFVGDRFAIEVYLLDFTGNLYGEILRIYFAERLRDELRFDSLEELTDAIAVDVENARCCLNSVQIIQYQEYLSEKE